MSLAEFALMFTIAMAPISLWMWCMLYADDVVGKKGLALGITGVASSIFLGILPFLL